MKTAVVTGANRGIGLESCRQLAQAGFKVFLTSRDEVKGQRAARELAAEKLNATFLQLDVADAQSATRFIEHLQGEEERIDALVNNAGIALDGFDEQVARRTLDVNFYGAVHLTDALMPLLGEDARIVMVSSGLGELSCLSRSRREGFESPVPTRQRLRELMEAFVESVAAGRHRQEGWPSSAYRVSKVGLNAFTRILGRELAGSSRLVNAVDPGWVQTDMGGPGATRSVEKGAAGIVWAATLPADGPTGGFFRDGRPVAW